MLKISTLHFEKQKKCFIPTEKRSDAKSELASISKQPALFTDPILTDGFGCTYHRKLN